MARESQSYGDAENIDTTSGDWVPGKPNTPTAAILVDTDSGNASDIRVLTERGTILTIEDVPSGTILPIEVRRVYQTGTTADRAVAFYW